MYPVCKPYELFIAGLHHVRVGEVAKANRSWQEAMAMSHDMEMSHVEALSCLALSKHHQVRGRRKQLNTTAILKLTACGMESVPGYI